MTVKKKPRGKGRPFQKGPDDRRYHGGLPKQESSITYWVKEFAGLTPQAIADWMDAHAKEWRALTGPMPVSALIASRALLTNVHDVDGRSFGHLLDRIDGKLTIPFRDETPRDKVIALLRDKKITPEEVQRALGVDLATELFESAGIVVAQSGAMAAAGAGADDEGA